MKDFLDVLLEQMDQPRSAHDEAIYLNRLKSLATTAPPQRKIPSRGSGVPLRATTLKTAPDSRLFQSRPDVELFFYELKDEQAEPRWFRQAKDLDPLRAFGRWDPLPGEAQVLETIAMGADLYSLKVQDHDTATLQYLAEVGVDYGVPVLLRCTSEEELARALFVEADTWIGLEAAVAVPELLELPIFENRQVLLPYGNAEEWTRHQLKQLILHIEIIEEPQR
ncbi:hypothetical protein [Oligoflexus tunisiensis]|uniref:hypothetical protein n=1 Tax=Oligoflexus tunisiensis TaxID=708132 RepID=UPI000AEBC89C|nr:hypothetical protein [Oligoflexus tunisiensis]